MILKLVNVGIWNSRMLSRKVYSISKKNYSIQFGLVGLQDFSKFDRNIEHLQPKGSMERIIIFELVEVAIRNFRKLLRKVHPRKWTLNVHLGHAGLTEVSSVHLFKMGLKETFTHRWYFTSFKCGKWTFLVVFHLGVSYVIPLLTETASNLNKTKI